MEVDADHDDSRTIEKFNWTTRKEIQKKLYRQLRRFLDGKLSRTIWDDPTRLEFSLSNCKKALNKCFLLPLARKGALRSLKWRILADLSSLSKSSRVRGTCVKRGKNLQRNMLSSDKRVIKVPLNRFMAQWKAFICLGYVSETIQGVDSFKLTIFLKFISKSSLSFAHQVSEGEWMVYSFRWLLESRVDELQGENKKKNHEPKNPQLFSKIKLC